MSGVELDVNAGQDRSILDLVLVDTLEGAVIYPGTVLTSKVLAVLGSERSEPPLELKACTSTRMSSPLLKV